MNNDFLNVCNLHSYNVPHKLNFISPSKYRRFERLLELSSCSDYNVVSYLVCLPLRPLPDRLPPCHPNVFVFFHSSDLHYTLLFARIFTDSGSIFGATETNKAGSEHANRSLIRFPARAAEIASSLCKASLLYEQRSKHGDSSR